MNRAVVAARAAQRPATRSSGTPGRPAVNLLARTITPPSPVGFEGVRRHGNKRSGKGGSSTGGVNGLWRSVSPTKRDAVQIDSRWSASVSNRAA